MNPQRYLRPVSTNSNPLNITGKLKKFVICLYLPLKVFTLAKYSVPTSKIITKAIDKLLNNNLLKVSTFLLIIHPLFYCYTATVIVLHFGTIIIERESAYVHNRGELLRHPA